MGSSTTYQFESWPDEVVVARRFRVKDRVIHVLEARCPEQRGGCVGLLDRAGRVLGELRVDPGSGFAKLSRPIDLAPGQTFYLAAPSSRFGEDVSMEAPSLAGTEFLGEFEREDEVSSWRPCRVRRSLSIELTLAFGAKERVTPRREQIMRLAAMGMTDKQIAAKLEISRHTVDCHWRRLRERLSSASRTETVSAWLTEQAERRREDVERDYYFELLAAHDRIRSLEGLAAIPVYSWPAGSITMR